MKLVLLQALVTTINQWQRATLKAKGLAVRRRQIHNGLQVLRIPLPLMEKHLLWCHNALPVKKGDHQQVCYLMYREHANLAGCSSNGAGIKEGFQLLALPSAS